MLIDSFAREITDGEIRLTARVRWEDCDRPEREIFFRIKADPSDVAEDPRLAAEAFLVGCFVPAVRHGETRIKVDGPVCPWLKDNLRTLEGYLINWYWRRYGRKRDDRRTIVIESDGDRPASSPMQEPRAASFFSGGVDSLYTLWRNRESIPSSHPGSIKDLIFVHGFDMGGTVSGGYQEELFEGTARQFESFVEQTNANMILVSTNLRHLDSNVECWLDEFQGAAMSAVAHALSRRLTDVMIASSYEIAKLEDPLGSHPLIDPRYSSFGLRVHHDGERTSRADKVAAIASWPQALKVLRVCFHGTAEDLNCGQCDKCVRTMLELLSAGKLADAGTFEANDVTASDIDNFIKVKWVSEDMYRELVRRCKLMQRKDLSNAMRKKLLFFYLAQPFNVKEFLKKLDRTSHFGWVLDWLYAARDALRRSP